MRKSNAPGVLFGQSPGDVGAERALLTSSESAILRIARAQGNLRGPKMLAGRKGP